ncbi:MAG: hypothetical protein ABEH77_07180 [Halobacteriaceae archaeon]
MAQYRPEHPQLPEKRAFACVDCDYRLIRSCPPHVCPRCGGAMKNELAA